MLCTEGFTGKEIAAEGSTQWSERVGAKLPRGCAVRYWIARRREACQAGSTIAAVTIAPARTDGDRRKRVAGSAAAACPADGLRGYVEGSRTPAHPLVAFYPGGEAGMSCRNLDQARVLWASVPAEAIGRPCGTGI
jgi:hypothetical protein